VSSRTYLSIGDVLTLLREEFPDVTISKIRFLESQGLVNPERSPSGYRKFFDHDVERLRWVLRQQREHFLPLKVIRDRLADGDLDDEGVDRAVDTANGKPPGAAHAAAGGAPATPLTAPGVVKTEEQPTKADEEAMARILADASRRAARVPEGAHVRRGLQVVGEDGASVAATVRPDKERGAEAPSTQRGADGGRRGGAAGDAADPPVTPQRSAARDASGDNGTPRTRRTDPDAGEPRTGRAPAETKARQGHAPSPPAAGDSPVAATTPSPAADTVAGASLSVEELCAAGGLSVEEVAGLQGFGLIGCVTVAGIEIYDEDALTVAKLAKEFRAFGIEPRHLRLYRNAVDREMGLIEQVVIPLLRQRNPESRQRAVEGAEQLAALGQSMRATLLRLALRQHLGG
jgi:DNA-binding transcriptional MerR regulator